MPLNPSATIQFICSVCVLPPSLQSSLSAFCTQPAFYCQSTVCIVPLVHSLQSTISEILGPIHRYPDIFESANFLSRYSFRLLESSESGALSIQQKFQFEILETARAQWNGRFRYRPDPSHRAFCYCGLIHSRLKITL